MHVYMSIYVCMKCVCVYTHIFTCTNIHAASSRLTSRWGSASIIPDCIYVYIFTHMYTYVYTCSLLRLSSRMRQRIDNARLNINVYTHVQLIHMCVYTQQVQTFECLAWKRLPICMCIYIYTCIYMCIYIHTIDVHI